MNRIDCVSINLASLVWADTRELTGIDPMRAIQLLFSNLDHFRSRFYLVFFIGFIDGVVTFFIPVALSYFVSSAIAPELALRLTLLIALLSFASHGMQFILRSVGESLGPQLSQYLRIKYFQRLSVLPLKDLSKHHSGYLLTLVSVVADGMGGLTIELFWGLSRAFANIGLFFFFSWKQSLAMAMFNSVILVAFVLLSGLLSRRLVPAVQNLSLERAKLFALFADFASQIGTVKRLGLDDFARAKLQAGVASADLSVTMLQRKHATRWLTLHSLFSLSIIGTIGFLLSGIAAGDLQPGILILFVSAFTAVRLNAERLSEGYKTVVELDGHIQNLSQVITEGDTGSLVGVVPDSWQTICCKDLSFSHDQGGYLISVPTLEISRGERVGIAGVSGAGKTTILHLVANLLAPISGRREVDGLSYEEIRPSFFSRNIAVVSQEAELFNLSLRDNLLLGGSYTDSVLIELLAELGLNSWYDALPSGLDTLLGERGLRLSQGEKQRVNLLRAYLLNRQLVLLDEVTAHLDITSARLVQQFVSTRLKDKTLMIVAHRPEMLRLCTKVYSLQGGTLYLEG